MAVDRKLTVQMVLKPPNLTEINRALQGVTPPKGTVNLPAPAVNKPPVPAPRASTTPSATEGFDTYAQAKKQYDTESQRAQVKAAYAEMYGAASETKSALSELIDLAGKFRGTLGGVFGSLLGGGLDLLTTFRDLQKKTGAVTIPPQVTPEARNPFALSEEEGRAKQRSLPPLEAKKAPLQFALPGDKEAEEKLPQVTKATPQTASDIASKFNQKAPLSPNGVSAGGATAAEVKTAAPKFDASQFIKAAPAAEAAEGAASGIGGAAAGAGGLAAAAGPAGAIAAATVVAAGIAKTVGEIPGSLAASGIGAFASSLKGLQSGLGPITSAFQAAETAGKGLQLGLTGLATVVGGPVIGALVYGLGEGLLKVVGPAKELTEAMFGLAKAANPAIGKQFDYAVADSAAVMGRVFIPVLQLATDGVRLFGDVLATVLPSSQEVRAALAPLKDTMAELRDAFADIAPIIRNTLITALQLFGQWLSNVARNISFIYQQGRALLGLGPTSQNKLASSTDAAASQASFHGFAEYAQQNQLRAYSQGKENVQTPTEGYLKEIRDAVDALKKKFVDGPQQTLGNAVVAAGKAAATAEEIASVFRKVIDPLGALAGSF